MAGRGVERTTLVAALALLVVVVGGVIDLILDDPERWWTPHVVFEIGLIGAALGLSVWLWRGWATTATSLASTRAALEERGAERDAWRRSARAALEGLGREIDRQFRAWGLTPAEREVALLLVKGYSHKEIAALTDRSERTARQHAVAVYRKAGLGGRAELAAFFLEDLLLPEPARGAGSGEGDRRV